MIRPNRPENAAGAIDPSAKTDSPSRRFRLSIIGSPSHKSDSSRFFWSVAHNLAKETTVEMGQLGGSVKTSVIEYARELAGLWQQVGQAQALLVGLDSQLAIITRFVPTMLAARFYGRRLIVLIDLPTPDRRIPKSIRLSRSLLRLADHLVVQTEWEAIALRRLGVTTTVIPPVMSCALGQLIKNVQPHLHVQIDRGRLLELERIYRTFTIVRQKYPRIELTISACADSKKSVELFLKRSSIGSDPGVHFGIDRGTDSPSPIDLTICLDTQTSFPLSLLSAWRSGTPALVPSYSIAFSMVKDRQNAIVYSEYGSGSLADTIIELVESPSLVQQLSAQGLKESMSFDWATLLSRWWLLLTQ